MYRNIVPFAEITQEYYRECRESKTQMPILKVIDEFMYLRPRPAGYNDGNLIIMYRKDYDYLLSKVENV